MKRAELETMGLEKEMIDQIMQINGADIENAKATLQKQVDGLTEQIAAYNTQLDELKKSAGDNEALSKQITDLQAENARAKEAHDAELNQLRIDFAVDKALTNANSKNHKAVRALLDLTDAKFDKEGNIKGLQEQIEALSSAEDSKFLFGESVRTGQFKGVQLGDATVIPGSKQADYEIRMADARKNNNLTEILKIKQEAYADGFIVD